MSTSATRRILHIATDNLSDLRDKQFGNALSGTSYYKDSDKATSWGAKDLYGLVQEFASWDKSVVFNKLYLGGESGGIQNPITIARAAVYDEPYGSTTRADYSINIGRGAGVGMYDSGGHINMGDFAGAYSRGGTGIYGQNINIGYYSGIYTDGFGNVNIGSTTTHFMKGNWNVYLGGDTGIYTSGNYNTCVGYGGGNYMQGNYNAGFGFSTFLYARGSYNTALGYGTANQCDLNYSTLVGYSAGSQMKSTSGSVAIGYGAGTYTSGDYNVALGGDCGFGTSGDGNFMGGKGIFAYCRGHDNVVIGKDGVISFSGSDNVMFGKGIFIDAGANAREYSDNNVIIGSYATEKITSAVSDAIVIGNHALASASPLNRVVGIGKNVLGNATDVDDLVAIGTSAGYYAYHPDSVLIGYKAGAEGGNISGQLVALGYEAGYKSNSYRTIMIGRYAGANAPSGFAVGTFIGDEAGRYGQMNDCIAIGEQAGYAASGVDNIYIGEYAGKTSTGSNCVFIGENVGENNTESSKFAIGNTASQILLSGDFTTGEVIVDHMKFPRTTEPSVGDGNYGFIFASAAGGFGADTELYVMDGQSNITRISPHNDEGEWEYFSRNKKTGKTIKINMERFIRKMEELTGETFIEES